MIAVAVVCVCGGLIVGRIFWTFFVRCFFVWLFNLDAAAMALVLNGFNFETIIFFASLFMGVFSDKIACLMLILLFNMYIMI